MNRRDFLASLLAMGASVALPVPIALATPTQLDDAWHQLQDCPLLFVVEYDGTIVDPTVRNPERRHDIYSFHEPDFSSPGAVIGIVGTTPFHRRLEEMAHRRCEEAVAELATPVSADRRRHLQALVDECDEYGEFWQFWIEWEGPAILPVIRGEYLAWLDDYLDGDDVDFLPELWGQRGEAKKFFEDLDRKPLELMGVRIVNGSHPGGSYFAAQMVGSIEAANAGAQSLGFPFRFGRA